MSGSRQTAQWLLAGVLVSLPIATPGLAATWHVARDGSGDFQVIQYALDAAAAGDTILVGPGRFDEFFDVEGPAWTRPAVAWIDTDDLTIVGAGRDATILGPAVYYEPPGVAAMIVGCAGNYGSTIRGVTIEGAWDGIYWWQAELDLSDCRIRNCELGIHASHAGPVHILDSMFEGRSGLSSGIFTYYSEGPVEIFECVFAGAGAGVSAVSSDVAASDSEFGCQLGVAAQNSASVHIASCSMDSGVEQGVDVVGFSTVDVVDSYIHAIGLVVSVRSDGTFSGTNSIFTGGGYLAAIEIAFRAQATINDCHILKEGDYAVLLEGYTGDLLEHDLTNNYWGTTDTELIAEWIWDGNDDPEIHSVVNFQPIAGGEVPVELRTWSTVKGLFSGGAGQ